MGVLIVGTGITTTAIAEGELTNIDGSLVDIHGDYIIDNYGNTISIGGGVAGGDAVISSVVTAGDDSTVIYTTGNDVTSVTWE